jgi:hypothetical protein
VSAFGYDREVHVANLAAIPFIKDAHSFADFVDPGMMDDWHILS